MYYSLKGVSKSPEKDVTVPVQSFEWRRVCCSFNGWMFKWVALGIELLIDNLSQ